MRRILVFTVLCMAFSLFGCAGNGKAPNDYGSSVVALDRDASQTLAKFLKRDVDGRLRSFLRSAHAVMVIPTYGKAAFIVSVRGGSGVLAARGEDGRWNGPVFYGFGSPGVGLQVGIRTQSVVMAFRTPEALRHFLKNGLTGGASFAIEFLNAGMQDNAGWDDAATDVMVVTELSGLYAGAGFEAGIVSERDRLNAELWGVDIGVDKILRGEAGHRDTSVIHLLETVDAPQKEKGETEVSPLNSSGVSEGT